MNVLDVEGYELVAVRPVDRFKRGRAAWTLSYLAQKLEVSSNLGHVSCH